MARGFSPTPEASVEVLDAARRALHRTHIAVLAQSRNRTVRETIACRDDVPLGLQAALAQDEATEVRSAIAANAHTGRSVLAYLSSDRNQAVLASLLANPSIPFEIVDGLVFHRRAGVRRLAAARLNDVGRLPQVEEPQEEDAKFPELRERATLMEVVEVVEEVAALGRGTHEFAVVDMAAHGLIPPWATPPSRFSAQGASEEPTDTRTAPARGFRVSAAL